MLAKLSHIWRRQTGILWFVHLIEIEPKSLTYRTYFQTAIQRVIPQDDDITHMDDIPPPSYSAASFPSPSSSRATALNNLSSTSRWDSNNSNAAESAFVPGTQTLMSSVSNYSTFIYISSCFDVSACGHY